MAERSFFVAFLAGVLCIILAYVAGQIVLPEWTRLNIFLVVLAFIVCLMNYVNEYLGLSPLQYSKFSSDGQLNGRLGWTVAYFTPAALYLVLWLVYGKPSTTFHLVAMGTYVAHFLKRVLECLLLHKYSKKSQISAVIQVTSFYGLGAVVQHYWCNIYTTQPLAQQLSANQTARNIGLALFVVGELINFYHHMELASLRPEGSTSYVIPRGGLFNYVVCPHYFGELMAWFGAAVACQHLALHLSWLTMVCYLAGRSHKTYHWYLKKIENFPRDRRNMMPGIY